MYLKIVFPPLLQQSLVFGDEFLVHFGDYHFSLIIALYTEALLC